MKQQDGRWKTASLGRGPQKHKQYTPPGLLASCCCFVPRPIQAVFHSTLHSHAKSVTKDGRSSGKKGFTLVEILATFVLMAIILPVAMQGISAASKLASQARHRVTAGVLAEQMLSELVLTDDYEDGDQDGEVLSGNTYYAWELEVSDWEEESSMQQLDLSVTWEDTGGRESIVLLSTLVYTGGEE